MAEVKRDTAIHAKNGAVYNIVRVLWQLHCGFVQGWVSFHRNNPPADLDMGEHDIQVIRAFDLWCLHDNQWREPITADLFGPCIVFAEYIGAPQLFIDSVGNVAYDALYTDERTKWTWNKVLPFLDNLSSSHPYAYIIQKLITLHSEDGTGWWDCETPFYTQRLLAQMKRCLVPISKAKNGEAYYRAFDFFLNHAKHPEVATFLSDTNTSREIWQHVMKFITQDQLGHFESFMIMHDEWTDTVLDVVKTSSPTKSHIVKFLTKLKSSM
jgi:hypothetical protein